MGTQWSSAGEEVTGGGEGGGAGLTPGSAAQEGPGLLRACVAVPGTRVRESG